MPSTPPLECVESGTFKGFSLGEGRGLAGLGDPKKESGVGVPEPVMSFVTMVMESSLLCKTRGLGHLRGPLGLPDLEQPKGSCLGLCLGVWQLPGLPGGCSSKREGTGGGPAWQEDGRAPGNAGACFHPVSVSLCK